MAMALVVNDIKPGKSWFVSWDMRGIPTQTNANVLKKNEIFICGETLYIVVFTLFCSTSNRWYSKLHFETTKGNDKLNDQVSESIQNSTSSGDKKSGSMVTVFHKGIRKEGLLRNALRLTWPIRNVLNPQTGFKNAVAVFQEEYPDNICNFQIIIEIPDDEYETRGLKFINKNLSELLENGLFADIKFVFEDDHIAAHSTIIAASSPVFAAMFESGRFKEGQTRTVNIEDIDSRVFRKLLQFLYTGSSGSSRHEPSDVLQSLYLAADKYQVDALKEICEQCLICQLEIENVLYHLVWADLYGVEKLKEAAITHMVKHRNRIWQMKEWEDFNRKYPDLFYEVCQQMFN
jgi:BTB/POZ domain